MEYRVDLTLAALVLRPSGSEFSFGFFMTGISDHSMLDDHDVTMVSASWFYLTKNPPSSFWPFWKRKLSWVYCELCSQPPASSPLSA